MRVELLDTVEDANEFAIGEPLSEKMPFTVGHRQFKHHIARVDKIRKGAVVDLPATQAEKLISLGRARLVS